MSIAAGAAMVLRCVDFCAAAETWPVFLRDLRLSGMTVDEETLGRVIVVARDVARAMKTESLTALHEALSSGE